ncbi:Fanconi anemia group J protein homolog [Lasioglossum baleicum]|uniref:Fanconi anemia group J protein homolog n=1 Tax=Lasioglossum baleicum TaxID=434251 RepID=UPI003FCD532D
MLVACVITAVIGYVIYTVIKLKIEERFEEVRMSRLGPRKRHSSETESQMDSSITLDGQDIVEISSDESGASELEFVGLDAEAVLQFQKSTDSLHTDEDEQESVFGYQSGSNGTRTMFKWAQRNAGQNQGSKTAQSNSDSDDFLQEAKWFHRNQMKKVKRNEAPTYELTGTSEEEKDEVVPEVIPQYEQMISGIKVKLPVKPYSCQIAVMNKLIQGCTKGENCLLESPTGSGKTLALLCGVLAWHDHHSEEVRKRIAKQSEDAFPGMPDEEFPSSCCGSEKECSNGFNIGEDQKRTKLSKIYYGTRTHKQIEQVIRELRKTTYKHKRMTILSSREHTCIQESKKNKTELCNELLDVKNHAGCRYNNALKKEEIHLSERMGLEPIWDIEDLVASGKQRGLCPYFAARNFMEIADIIFCPYNYLIDPDIRESMQLNITDHVIILDEAHNIEDICRDVASVDFREDYLDAAAADCMYLAGKRRTGAPKYDIVQAYILRLKEYLKSITLTKPDYNSENLSSPYWTGAELLELFNMNNLGETAYPAFLNACSAALDDFKEAKEQTRDNPPESISQATKILIEHLMYCMKMISSPQYTNDYRACVTETTVKDFRQVQDDTWQSAKNGGQRVRTLKLLCMNPGVIFAPLAKAARCIILASGTLTPTTSFQSELNTKFDHVLNTGHVIPKEQVFATCVPRGSHNVSLKATYQNVNGWAFQDELGQVLLDVCESVPHGILCFFSSYNMMNTQLSRWKKTSIWNKMSDIKQVFLEPRYGGDLNNIMNDYRAVIKETADGPSGGINGALFLAVFRGKVAEGIDFRDDEARCVVTVGIPYAVRKDPVIDMKFKYNDMNVARGLLKGSDWYSIQAFRALNQALGRCLRHMKDWGAVLLVDERFLSADNKDNLPKWVKTMWTNHMTYNLRPQLRDFVARQKAREAKETPL